MPAKNGDVVRMYDAAECVAETNMSPTIGEYRLIRMRFKTRDILVGTDQVTHSTTPWVTFPIEAFAQLADQFTAVAHQIATRQTGADPDQSGLSMGIISKKIPHGKR